MDNIVPPKEQLTADDLVIFAKVVELGSFTAAANRLGLPKSTVSRRISQLEQVLGEQVLLRTTRRLRLTEFGEQLLEHAQQISLEVGAAQQLSDSRQAQPSGRLRVSMPADFANILLVDMLAAFSALHPHVSLELDLSARRVDLLDEAFDLALRVGNVDDNPQLIAKQLRVFECGLYASSAYLRERGTPATPDQLMQFDSIRLMTGQGASIPWLLKKGQEQWQGLPPGRLTANSPELLINLACRGAGIIAVPHYFTQIYQHKNLLQRVLPEWCLPAQTAWAVFPSRQLMPTKTRAFLTMLETALQFDD